MYVRRRAALLGALLISVSVVGPASAQEEPTPVPYLDAEGNQLGTILIREFADPFTGFDPASPPAEGQRYAVLTVTFEAAEDQSFPTDPYQVQLLDSNGSCTTRAGSRARLKRPCPTCRARTWRPSIASAA